MGPSVNKQLYISEIYKSIQGESTYTGKVCTFIRLSGCPLRCAYCDTPYALNRNSGNKMSVQAVFDRVKELGSSLVEITGGEPLVQNATHDLALLLVNNGYKVLLETSGAFSLSRIPQQVVKIVDVKGPRSGEREKWKPENLESLDKKDELKFVLHDKMEYQWAEEFCRKHSLFDKCEVLFSPVQRNWEKIGEHKIVEKGLEPAVLAEWMSENNSRARLQLQQHKFIWDPRAKGV